MAAGLAAQLLQSHEPCASGFRSQPSEIIPRLRFPPSRISFASSSQYSGLSSIRLPIKGRKTEDAASVLSPAPPAANRPRHSSAASSGVDKHGTKDQKWVHEGLITESLPNGMFRVRLENGDVILGYISGKIRRNSIRVLPGDKVKIEVSRYDSSRGRITFRLRSKDSQK